MLEVGIAGAGMMGRVHCNSYKNVKGARVRAVCDPVRERAEAVASSCGAAWYDDFDAMLGNENLDIVDICLPTFNRGNAIGEPAVVADAIQIIHVNSEQ